jgi:hypothetical protein
VLTVGHRGAFRETMGSALRDAAREAATLEEPAEL